MASYTSAVFVFHLQSAQESGYVCKSALRQSQEKKNTGTPLCPTALHRGPVEIPVSQHGAQLRPHEGHWLVRTLVSAHVPQEKTAHRCGPWTDRRRQRARSETTR
eukprot:4409360-Pyramimonas_sp.AAC.1